MLYWSQIPLVRLVLPMAFGIVLSSYLSEFVLPLFLVIIILFTALTLSFTDLKIRSYKDRWLWGVQLNLLLILIGFLMAILQYQKWDKNQLPVNQKVHWIGTVQELNTISDSSHRVIVQLSSILDDSAAQLTSKKVQLYVRSKKEIAVGDKISSASFLNPIPSAKNPAAFDYADFMKKRGVLYQSFIKDFDKVGEEWSLERTASTIRNKLILNYKEMGIANENLAVLVAISLGDKTYLESDLRAKYSAAGVMHILAVSGLHLGIVYLLFSTLLKPVKRLRSGEKIRGILLLFFIWFFAFLTGFSPSVQRAALMFSFIIVADMNSYDTHVLNSIAGSALLILLANPMMIFEVGFQLSYAAVIGIVMVHPIVYNFWRAPYSLIDKIWSLTVVSFSAQLATLPFVLYYFHQFPNWFLLANLFVIPLAFFIVSVAVIVAILYFLFSTAFGIHYLLKAALFLLNYIVEGLNFLPFFITDDIWISVFSAFLLALAITCFIAYLNTLRFTFLKASLISLILMFGIELGLTLKQTQEQQFNIYASSGDSVYSFVNGFSATVFIEDSLSVYNKEIVNNHLKSIGIREYEIHLLSNSISKKSYTYLVSENFALFSFDKKKILFVNRNRIGDLKEVCKIDYMVLKKGNYIEENDFKNCELEIILDGSISTWDYNYKFLTENRRIIAVNEAGFYFIK